MIVDVIAQWARTRPAKVALFHNDVAVNYASFARAIEAARRYLLGRVPAGRTAVVPVVGLRDSWIIVLALRSLGLDTICVQSLAQARSLQLRDVACVVTTEAPEDSRAAAGPAPAALVTVPAAALVADQAGDLPVAREQAAGGHMLHTSGSTGARKKVLLDAAAEDAANANRAQILSYGPDTVHHGLDFGLWTGVGFKQSAAVWHAGGCVVLDQRPDSLRHFFAHGVNRTRLLPPMLKEIIETADLSQKTSDLEIGTGGTIFPLELAQLAVARLTPNLTIAYSATELCSTPMQSRFVTSDDLHWLAPVGGRVVQVVDEDGRECVADQEGALRIGTNGLDSTAYVDDDDATARAFRDGFFYPNDLAVKRADGRVRILGRLDDIINMAGQKLAAAPIELSLQRSLRVAEVCLFSRPFGEGKQELVIAIETDRELAQYELDAVARDFGAFDRVRFSFQKQFPRTESGTRKTRRSELKKIVFAPP